MAKYDKQTEVSNLEKYSTKSNISRALLSLFYDFKGYDEGYISNKIAENIEKILFIMDSPNCTKDFYDRKGTHCGFDAGYINQLAYQHRREYESNMEQLKPLLKKYKSFIDDAEKTHVEQVIEKGQPER